jgi:hypothetical protein
MFEGLMRIYNITKHGAFNNEYSPIDMAHPSNLRILNGFIAKSNTLRNEVLEARGENELKDGEYVRILRAREGYSKQALPALSYDVYQVQPKEEEKKQEDEGEEEEQINPRIGDGPLVRLRRLHQAGRPEYPRRHDKGKDILVHHSKIMRIKTVEGTDGETFDPPEWSRWNLFLENFRNDRFVPPGRVLHAEADYNVS